MARHRLDFGCGGSVRFDVTATEGLRVALDKLEFPASSDWCRLSSATSTMQWYHPSSEAAVAAPLRGTAVLTPDDRLSVLKRLDELMRGQISVGSLPVSRSER